MYIVIMDPLNSAFNVQTFMIIYLFIIQIAYKNFW